MVVITTTDASSGLKASCLREGRGGNAAAFFADGVSHLRYPHPESSADSVPRSGKGVFLDSRKAAVEREIVQNCVGNATPSDNLSRKRQNA
jgi:hypothetical protein